MGIKLANISNAATAARRLIKSKTGKNFDINKPGVRQNHSNGMKKYWEEVRAGLRTRKDMSNQKRENGKFVNDYRK